MFIYVYTLFVLFFVCNGEGEGMGKRSYKEGEFMKGRGREEKERYTKHFRAGTVMKERRLLCGFVWRKNVGKGIRS